MAAKWIELVTGSLEQKKQYRQERAASRLCPSRTAPSRRRWSVAYQCSTGASRTARLPSRCSATSPTSERAAADGTPVRAIVGDDLVEFADTFAQAYTERDGSTRNTPGQAKAIEDAERKEQE